ncbi:MAG: hypothetical protein HYU36_16525 [Planctomycetes bacterium]|nr:hypothetical protein [Planctomycetota bacterium]
MRFRLLGSSAGKTVPRPFCACRVCEHAKRCGGRDRRTRTGMHLFAPGEEGAEPQLAVDLPPDTGHHMMRGGFNLSRLEHLLFTHSHEDHFDLTCLGHRAKLMSDSDQMPLLQLYGSADTARAFDQRQLDAERLKLQFHVVQPGQAFAAGEFRVIPLDGHHSPGTLHYVIQHAGRSALLAWDTGYYLDDQWKALSAFRFDAVFLECTTLRMTDVFKEGPGHLNFYTFLKMRERMLEIGCLRPSTPLIATHIGDNGLLTHSECEGLAGPYGVTVGYDGLELEL